MHTQTVLAGARLMPLAHIPLRLATTSATVPGALAARAALQDFFMTADVPAPRPALGERSVALALAYSTISAAWYLVGMVMVLTGSSAALGGSSVLRRLALAWGLTFAASQVSTPWRAAGAVALSPLVLRVLNGIQQRVVDRLRLRLPPSAMALLPALLYALALAAACGAGVATVLVPLAVGKGAGGG